MTFRVIILPQTHRDIDRNADWWADHHSVEQAVRWADTVYVLTVQRAAQDTLRPNQVDPPPAR